DDGPEGAPAVTTQFVYDGEQIALAFEGPTSAAPLTHRYVYGPGVDQVLADERVAAGSAVVWPLADPQGSVRDLLTTAGTIASSVRYNSYGQIVGTPPSDLYFAYTGREYDAETGLYFYRARYYDPQTGSFLSEDPKDFGAGDPNFYRYVR